MNPSMLAKSNNTRDQSHLNTKKGADEPLPNKINKIRKETGNKPIIIHYKESLFESDAFDLETRLIKTIGRKDLGLGPLLNLTDGGEGESGRIISEETRIKYKIKNVAKEKIILTMERKHHHKKEKILVRELTKQSKKAKISVVKEKNIPTKPKRKSVKLIKVNQPGIKEYLILMLLKTDVKVLKNKVKQLLADDVNIVMMVLGFGSIQKNRVWFCFQAQTLKSSSKDLLQKQQLSC